MNPATASKGNSFAGVIGYITHDIGKDTDERVAFVETLNMRTADPEKAAKVMAWTKYHAASLKEAGGIKATGNKTKDPVYHVSLNWAPGEKPTHAHMVDTAKSALAALGYIGHEVVLAAHTDKDHQHIHIVVNRIHPETGRTHNPNNDYAVLQRWAYGYEKAQGRIFCLERAVKYEKDKSLKADYQKRLSAEIDTGKLRESKPRPQWEAEKEATHPKSKRYQDIKAELAVRVRGLAKTTRESLTRRGAEWDGLKSRHAEERAALWGKQQAAFKNLRTFERAAKPAPAYSWKAYQADRAQLKTQHASTTTAFRAELKAKDAPEVATFKASQKTAWREFYRLEKAEVRGQLDKSLKVVTSSPVGKHGAQHRDHLAKLFNAHVTKGVREEQFAAILDAQKREFFGGITQRNAPVLAALKEGHQAEVIALRQTFDQAQGQAKARASRVETNRDADRAERTQLATNQRAERAATKAKHAEETANQQEAWAALNTDRSSLWDGYKRMRESQAQEKTSSELPGKTKEAGDLFAARQITGRDYAQPGESATRASTGREISRKGPA